MDNKLDSYHQPVTGRNILRFALPTMVMTVFNAFYTMVDGLFVSNLIGTEALSAINLTAPAIGLITAVSGMLATGGSAVVMNKMGEGRDREAREDFTLLIAANAVAGAVMMVLGYALMDRLLGTMGLSPAVFDYCRDYLSAYLPFTIPILLMYNFSLYLIAADRPRLSLICTVAGGVTNIVLDFVLVGLAGLGLRGAAIATGLGYSITAAAGFLVFGKRESLLHFQRPVLRVGVRLVHFKGEVAAVHMDAHQPVAHPRRREVGVHQLLFLPLVHQGVDIGGGVRDRAAEALHGLEGHLGIKVHHMVFLPGVGDKGDVLPGGVFRGMGLGRQQGKFHRSFLISSLNCSAAALIP